MRARLFERERRGWLDDVVFWRWLSAGAGTVAAAALVFAFVMSRPPAPTVVAPMIAAINLDDGRPAFLATIDLARGTMLVLPVPPRFRPTKSPSSG